MSLDSYYRESIEIGLEEAGALNLLTKDQITTLVESVLGARENESMATGRGNIPNPLAAEVDRLERARQADRNEAEERERRWRKGLGLIIKVEPNRLSVDEWGNVEVNRT